jgi:AcrR family transcriptional regulator
MSDHDTLGTMPNRETGLRERTRRAVQREIADAASALIVERGYDATTIADIAAAVGMSPRSVFRYFATKEEILVGELSPAGEAMVDIVSARPPAEPAWTSLRRLFDVIGPPERQQPTRPIQHVIFETPALLAVYLQKLQNIQTDVAEALRTRTAYAPDDPTPQVLTAAAFACFVAAQQTWLAAPTTDPLTTHLDRAMATLTPTA